MSTTQTLAAQADLQDLIGDNATCPATRASLDAWLSTVLPATPRPTTQVLAVTLAAPRGTYTGGQSTSTAGVVAVVASILGVGAMLVSALSFVTGV